MKNLNRLLILLFLTSFLTLFFYKGYAIAPPIVIDPLANDTICPYVDPKLSLSNFKPGDWTYEWKFVKGTPSTYSGSSPSVNWTVEGTFLITLIAKEWDEANPPPFNPKSIEYDTISITIDGTCCPNLPVISVLVDGRSYDSVYYVEEDLTLGTNESITIRGSLLLDGVVTTNEPGGDVSAPFIFMESNSRITIIDAYLKGYCERMWGGIEVGEEASIDITSSYFSDSYYGIYYDSTNSSPYYFKFDDNTFFNNRVCLTVEDVDVSSKGYLLIRSIFDCDPETFLEPFIYNSGHNAGEEFRMKYAVRFEGNSDMDIDHCRLNEFNNGIVGLDVRLSDLNSFKIWGNKFDGNTLSGLVAKYVGRFENWESEEFIIPTDPNINSTQYSNVVIADYSFLPEDTIFGAAFDSVEQVQFFHNAEFFPNTKIPDHEFDSLPRVGIYVNHVEFTSTVAPHPDFHIQDASIEGMHVGVEFVGNPLTISFKESKLKDNETAIHINPLPYSVTGINIELGLNCNSFEKSNNVTNVDTWGLYIENGVSLIDIGGPGVFPSTLNPAGNRWPVDTANSTGYPNTTPGSGIHVNNWAAPANWISIYDGNGGTGSFIYWRWINEFVGDQDGAVDPATLVDSATVKQDSTPCNNQTTIFFPQTRIGNPNSLFPINEQHLNVWPNPTNGVLHIESLEKRIISYSLENSLGQIVFEENKLNHFKIEIDLFSFQKGVYLYEVILQDGIRQTGKIIR